MSVFNVGVGVGVYERERERERERELTYHHGQELPILHRDKQHR